MIRDAVQKLKGALNQALDRLGYKLVQADTLERLMKYPNSSISSLQQFQTAGGENSSIGRFRLMPSPNQPPAICTAHAPEFDPSRTPGRFAVNVTAFQQRGITIVGTNAKKAAVWRDAELFDRDVGNRHPAWDWAGNSIKSYSNDFQAGVPSRALIEELRVLFGGDDFEALFRGVLGCPVKVANVRLIRSLPHATDGVGPQGWHRDGCPAGVIRGVLYLCDVDRQTGPFQYKDKSGQEHTVLGKTGDLLLFDATRLLHRASPPTHHARYAIDLAFMPRMPDEEMQVLVAGMNHWPADPFFYKMPVERVSSALKWRGAEDTKH